MASVLTGDCGVGLVLSGNVGIPGSDLDSHIGIHRHSAEGEGQAESSNRVRGAGDAR